MKFPDRLIGWFPWLAAAIIVAGIVHILSILIMPRLASEDSYTRLSRISPVHKTTILTDIAKPKITLPYEDPATALSVCRFDLDDGPVRLKGQLPGNGLTLLSFRNRYGIAFYSLNDRGTSRGDLNVLILTRSQLEIVEADDPEDELPSELRLVSSSKLGFVLLRALAPEPGQFRGAIQTLNKITCSLEPLNQP